MITKPGDERDVEDTGASEAEIDERVIGARGHLHDRGTRDSINEAVAAASKPIARQRVEARRRASAAAPE